MAKFGFRCALAAAAFGACVPATALAAENSFTLHIRAEVQPYCQVWADSADASIALVDGRAELGGVREVCNTPFGYKVQANFVNLTGGTVNADGETAPVDANGEASFTYGQAQAQTRRWNLSDATTADAGMPVYMRVMISPI